MTIERGNSISNLKGAFVVDATGRKASVCRHLGVEKMIIDSQFAVMFSVKSPLNISQEIVVEATENGWWYVAPFGENELSINLCVEHA